MTLVRAFLDGMASRTLANRIGLEGLGDTVAEKFFFVFAAAMSWAVFLAVMFHKPTADPGQLQTSILAFGSVGIAFLVFSLVAMIKRIRAERKFVRACLVLNDLIFEPGCLEDNTLITMSRRVVVNLAKEAVKLWAKGDRGAEHDYARAKVKRAYDAFQQFHLLDRVISHYYMIAEQEFDEEEKKPTAFFPDPKHDPSVVGVHTPAEVPAGAIPDSGEVTFKPAPATPIASMSDDDGPWGKQGHERAPLDKFTEEDR